MEIATQKFARLFLGFALIAFLAITFLGISQNMIGMEKRANGTMRGCMFSGQAEICTMTFPEHLAHWQAMFTTTAPQKAPLLALVLLALVFVAIGVLRRNLLLLFSCRATKRRLYIKQNPHLSLFDPLKEAFSRGILNPKIFEPAIL